MVERAPDALRVFLCPTCGAVLTLPVVVVADPRLVGTDRVGTRVPPGAYTPTRLPEAIRRAMPEPRCVVWIHPHDLEVTEIVASRFGCCGFFHDGAPNLHCRCGRAVGILVDECGLTPEIALAATWRKLEQAPHDAGLSRRMSHALAAIDTGAPPIESVVWDWEAEVSEVSEVTGELSLSLRTPGPAGLQLTLHWRDQARVLPMAGLVLARAIAQRRLPIGRPQLLVTQAQVVGSKITEEWAMVRLGSEVRLEGFGVRTAISLGVAAEWLEVAWEEAVSVWEAG